jgi:capsular exopolysaccharide synthesis family protein
MDARSDARVYASAPDRASRRVRRQWVLFRRRLGLFLLVSLASFGAAAAVLLAWPPRYDAVAELMIDPRRERVVDVPQVLQDLPAETAAVDTEVEVLKSRALAERTVDRLHLDRDPRFASPRLPAEPRRTLAVEALRRSLGVNRLGLTYVIAVTARAGSPELASSMANTLAALYLRQQQEAKTSAALRASAWLNSRLGGLRAEVEAAEADVERYKAAHGLMTLGEREPATATEQEVADLDAQLAAAEAEEGGAKARLAAARAALSGAGAGDNLGEGVISQAVQDLRRQRDALAEQIAEMQTRYGPRHPDLIKAQHGLSDLDARIRRETDQAVANLDTQAKVAEGRSTALSARLAGAEADLARNNGASVRLKELERDRESARAVYQSFLDRSKQTMAQAGLAQPDARLISPAKPPTRPAVPNRPVGLAAAFVGAIGLGLLCIWSVEAVKDGLYDAEDVERRLASACLALIPDPASLLGKPAGRIESPADLLLCDAPIAFAEAFRALRATLSLSRVSGPLRTVAIASALPGEGKTTTCVALGRMIASKGGSVVVVDCDVRRRAMSQLIAAPAETGLLDVLRGAADLEQALYPDASGLTVMPLGDETVADESILESPAMDRLLEALRRRFRFVLLDTAPVLLAPETRDLAAKADAVVFLARWGRTRADVAGGAMRLLEEAGAYIAGAALTMADIRQTRSGPYGVAPDDYPFYRTSEPTP